MAADSVKVIPHIEEEKIGSETDKYSLDILSPLDKQDEPRVAKYLKHIKDAVENKDVKNLALSGVYGSGKSTIIKSFKSKYPDYSFLHISLASFKEEVEEYKEFKDQLQHNILQQIIYSHKADKLPQSRFNRITDNSYWSTQSKTLIASLFVFATSSYIIINFYSFQLNPLNWEKSLKFSWSFLVLASLFFVSFMYLGKYLGNSFASFRIKKFSLSDAEVGEKDENKDPLNKYLDEIIYFFEKVPVDIVAIEDLDRFNSTEIFRVLRDINILLNVYFENQPNSDYRKITFLYAIKDELFKNELDRTKFFDLLIPAIPFVNYNNSKNVLNSKLDSIYNGQNEMEKPTKEFINTVSIFITDNRILTNILNEFFIYKEQQQTGVEPLNPEKLLAIIIYKNLRPVDFARLHMRNSNIDLIFTNKNTLISNSVDALETEIHKNEMHISDINDQNLVNVKELNTIFIYHIQNSVPTAMGLVLENESKSFDSIITENLNLATHYDTPMFKYYRTNGVEYDLTETMRKIESKLAYKYLEKYDNIINKNHNILKLENEIQKYKDETERIKNYSLKEIFSTKNISKENLKSELESFYFEDEINEKDRAYNDPFLIFLLENGHIDEHYREYISLFQKGGLNESDHEFKRNLISRILQPKPIDYPLNNIEDIVIDLPLSHFCDSRILNLSLIEYLLQNKDTFSEKLNAVLRSISEWDNERTKEFLISYITRGTSKNILIENLVRLWPEIWAVLSSDSKILEKDKQIVLYLLLKNCSKEKLQSLNLNGALSDYISGFEEILTDFEGDKLTQITKIFGRDGLNVKFQSIKSFISDKYIKHLELVYQNNLYEINFENIRDIFIEFNEGLNNEMLNECNLSYIYESSLNELVRYIEQDNYYSYINNVYLNLEFAQFEEQDLILKILNYEFDIDQKYIFINKQKNKITKISSLTDPILYDYMLKENKVDATWENVYFYYAHKNNLFTKTLNDYLNENYYDLSGKIDVSEDEAIQNKFLLDLVTNNDLEDAAYETIIHNSIPKNYKVEDDFDFTMIGEYKVQVLIKNDSIPLTMDFVNKLSSQHPDLHIDLLLRKWDQFIYLITENKLAPKTFIQVLQSYDLGAKEKAFIIKNHIAIENLKDVDLLLEIADIILDNADKVDMNDLLDVERLKLLISSQDDDNSKIKLIYLHQNVITKKDLIEIQPQLSQEYHLYPKSQLMLENNDINKKYIEVLQGKNIAGRDNPAKKNKIRVWLLDYTKE